MRGVIKISQHSLSYLSQFL